MAYTYQADVWCDECADGIMADIRRDSPARVPEDYMDQASYDSDDWPKSYLPEQGESDGPDNCAGCRAFLGNQLTSAGYRYVKSMLDKRGATLPECAQEWADFYGFSWREECAECEYDADECECEEPRIVAEWRSCEM